MVVLPLVLLTSESVQPGTMHLQEVPAGESPDGTSNILQNGDVNFFFLTRVAEVTGAHSAMLRGISNSDDGT